MNRQWVEKIIEWWTLLTQYVLLNLLWAVSSLFVITAFPSTIALISAVRQIGSGYKASSFVFLQVFTSRFVNGCLLGTPVILCLLLTSVDAISLLRIGHYWLTVTYLSVAVNLDLFLIGTALHGIMLLAGGDWRMREIWRTSAKLVFLRPLKTLLTVIFVSTVCVISLRFSLFGILFGGSTIAFFMIKSTSSCHSMSARGGG